MVGRRGGYAKRNVWSLYGTASIRRGGKSDAVCSSSATPVETSLPTNPPSVLIRAFVLNVSYYPQDLVGLARKGLRPVQPVSAETGPWAVAVALARL